MSISLLAMALIAIYAMVSIGYVYRWRGRARYASFSEYLRKSWPVFAPFNCLLYLATLRSARGPVLDAGYLQGITLLRQRWAHIRDEAIALHLAGELDATTRRGSVGYYDLAFRTFYKRGWKKFYLKWYGTSHRSARRLCPETVRLLEQVPGIRAAMFSILPAGAELSLHADPMACSLRYHLGLETPNSDRCFINVDGLSLSWRNGEDFVFDETYPHYAKNATGELRLILMCDVDRPMNRWGRAFASLYATIARAMVVPNTAEDRRGFVSWLFSIAAPWRDRALQLKAQRRRTYLLLKFAVNSALVALLFGLFYAVLLLLEHSLLAAL